MTENTSASVACFSVTAAEENLVQRPPIPGRSPRPKTQAERKRLLNYGVQRSAETGNTAMMKKKCPRF